MTNNRIQHVVPQFYLRRFADCNGYLWCLHIKENRVFYADPSHIAAESYAFSIEGKDGHDSSFDQINNNVERFCAHFFSVFNIECLDVKLINAIWVLTGNLLLRSRRFRDFMVTPMRRIAKFIKSIQFPSPKNEHEAKIYDMFGLDKWNSEESSVAIEKSANVVYPISQMFLDEITKQLALRKFDLLRASSRLQFITSDDPIVLIRDGELIHPNSTVLESLDEPQVSLILPLSPDFVCRWQFGSSFSVIDIDVEEISKINHYILTSAYLQIYGNDKGIVSQYIKETVC